MDKHSEHLEYIESELTQGLGVLIKKPGELEISITGRQLTTAIKTCNIKPRLLLRTEQRFPVKRDDHPDALDLEWGEKKAMNLLQDECDDLSPYYAEIESVIASEPHKILSISEADASQTLMTLQPKAYGCGIESCEKCLESGKITCSTCEGTCKASCPKCSGKGQYIQNYQETVREACRVCAGTGRFFAYNQYRPCNNCFGGVRNQTYNRQRWVACGKCEQTGRVPCGTCSASGVVDCKQCDTKGSFLTEFKGVARYTVDGVTAYSNETLDGSSVKNIEPETDVIADDVTYSRIDSVNQDVITATESKQYLATVVSLSHPKLEESQLILSGTRYGAMRTENYIPGGLTTQGITHQKVPNIHRQPHGLADGLLSELLDAKNVKSISKKAKAIDIIKQVPALEQNSQLQLFSSKIKDRVAEIKSSFAAEVFKKAKAKRFTSMLAVWPITILAMYFVAYFVNIPLTLIFGDVVLDLIDESNEATAMLIGLIAISIGYFTYDVVDKGTLPDPGVPLDKKDPKRGWKRFGYFVFISASVFVCLFIIIGFWFGAKETEELMIYMAILLGSILVPSFFVARAISSSSAQEYLKRITQGRV